MPATFGEIEPPQQIAHPLHDLVARQLVALDQREGDVLDDVHRIEQRRVLEHHAELAAQLPHLDVVQRHDVDAVDPDLPAVRACSRPMRCFISTDFPCPEPPMMMLVLPAFDVEVDAAQHVLRPERLVQPAHADLPALVPLRERIAAGGSGAGAGGMRCRLGRLVHDLYGHKMWKASIRK